MKPKIFLLACCFVIALAPMSAVKAQLTVTPNQTAATLAAAIAGPGVVVSNASLTCPTTANGTFTGGTSPLGINNGIVLTSGAAAGVANPASYAGSDDNNTSGDADLTAIAGVPTFDACVLQFDFVPQGTSVSFDYQFGSEEYPQYSCSQYVDAFGFFLSGPGYSSPVNIALLPGTSTPVTINTTTGFGSCNPNHPYFINNVNGPAPSYDGLTTVLTATANVTSGSTYHLKLGVADGTDHSLNSGVFLKQGSLTIAGPVVAGCPGNISSCNAVVNYTPPTATSPGQTVTTTSNHNPGDTFPVGTTGVTYTFDNGYSQSTCTFNVTVYAPGTASVSGSTTVCSGSSTNLTFTGTPNSTISYNANGGSNQTVATGSGGSAIVSVSPVAATTYTITGITTPTCTYAASGSATVNTYALPFVAITSMTSPTCFGYSNGSISSVASGGTPGYTYLWSPGGATTATLSNAAAGAYTITVHDLNGCAASAGTTLTQPAALSGTVTGTYSVASCPAYNIYLGYGAASSTLSTAPSGGTGPYTYTWSPAGGIANIHAASTSASPAVTTTYTVTITDANGCTSSPAYQVKVLDVHCGPKYIGRELNNTVNVCHVLTNPSSTLCISPSAVPGHLAHADCLGICGQMKGVGDGSAGGQDYYYGPASIRLYPNPAHGEINVDLTAMSNVWTAYQITDLSGKLVAEHHLDEASAQNVLTIDISAFPRGMYLIRVAGLPGQESAISRFDVQ